MSMMKRFAEDLSEVLGHKGEINDTVMSVGRALQDIADQFGVKLSVEDGTITLEGQISDLDVVEVSLQHMAEEFNLTLTVEGETITMERQNETT